MGVVAWDEMAVQDLRDATNEPAIRQEFFDIAETELRYPPVLSADEGLLVEYNHGFAYRRALRRATPSRLVDLTANPIDVDGAGFPYGRYYFVYRPLTDREAREMGNRGQGGRLKIQRLLHDSAMVGQLPRQ